MKVKANVNKNPSFQSNIFLIPKQYPESLLFEPTIDHYRYHPPQQTVCPLHYEHLFSAKRKGVHQDKGSSLVFQPPPTSPTNEERCIPPPLPLPQNIQWY